MYLFGGKKVLLKMLLEPSCIITYLLILFNYIAYLPTLCILKIFITLFGDI